MLNANVLLCESINTTSGRIELLDEHHCKTSSKFDLEYVKKVCAVGEPSSSADPIIPYQQTVSLAMNLKKTLQGKIHFSASPYVDFLAQHPQNKDVSHLDLIDIE